MQFFRRVENHTHIVNARQIENSLIGSDKENNRENVV